MADETRYPSDLAERFQLRLPPGLRDRIAETAKVNNRSMNSEIVHTLSEQYPDTLPEARELHRRVFQTLDKISGGPNRELRDMISEYISYMIDIGFDPIKDEGSATSAPRRDDPEGAI